MYLAAGPQDQRGAGVLVGTDSGEHSGFAVVACDVRENQELAKFSRDLTSRHPDVPEVAGFREQARDYVRKAAPARVGDL